MNTYQKSFLIVAFAVIFAGGCAFNNRSVAEQKKNAVEEVVATTTQEVVATSTEAAVDASDWKTYRNEELGFEVKVSPEFSDAMEHVSEEKNGYVNWSSPEANLSIITKYTTTSRQAVFDEFGMDMNSDNQFSVNGLSGYRETQMLGKQRLTEGVYLYTDKVLVGRDGMYFYLSFSANSEVEADVNNAFSKWERILLSFDAIPSAESIDTSNWKTYRNEELGFEIKYPSDWLYPTSSKPDTQIGQGMMDDLGHWKDRIGEVSWQGYHVSMTISARKAHKTLDEMNQQLRMNYGRATSTVNGLLALRRKDILSYNATYDDGSQYQMHDVMLVQHGNQFYDIDFSLHVSKRDDAYRVASEWMAVLKSFKVFPIK